LLKEFPGFNWRWDNITLRDTTTWVNLAKVEQQMPYFYAKCLHTVQKTGVVSFKTNKTAFPLSLVIDSRQWSECQEFMAEREVNVHFQFVYALFVTHCIHTVP
jgi:hypothetical protein